MNSLTGGEHLGSYPVSYYQVCIYPYSTPSNAPMIYGTYITQYDVRDICIQTIFMHCGYLSIPYNTPRKDYEWSIERVHEHVFSSRVNVHGSISLLRICSIYSVLLCAYHYLSLPKLIEILHKVVIYLSLKST